MAKLRKIQHLRTNVSQYVEIERGLILDIHNVPTYDSVPTSQELIGMVNPPKYIFISSTDKYYTLQGKKPEVQILDYGEIAISYGKNNEAIYLKNSNNEIIEIGADVTKQIVNVLRGLSGNTVGISDDGNIEVAITQEHGKITDVEVINRIPRTYRYVTTNPYLAVPSDQNCLWKIEYSELIDNNIDIETAVVHLREKATGKQVIPDVTFNESEQQLQISIFSHEDILEDTYIAIIIG